MQRKHWWKVNNVSIFHGIADEVMISEIISGCRAFEHSNAAVVIIIGSYL